MLVSAASAWEIATKDRLGKLGLPGVATRFGELVALHGFEHLAVDHRHALRAGSIVSAHRDPFDRMLAAQSEIDDVPLITIDRAFHQFGTPTIW